MNRKVIIIGAGFGGLAAAALLGKAGFDVLVLEKNKTIGGRARVFKKKGFTFDMGPSWYLMPDIFERFFANFDKKPTDFFTLKRLNPAYRMFFDKKKTIDIAEKLSDNVKLFDSLEKGGGEAGLSKLGWDFVGNILHRASDLCLILNASVNAYRRLDPAYEAPNQIKASANDRSSMIRIPFANEKTARIEVRSVAPDANPYLVAFALHRNV